MARRDVTYARKAQFEIDGQIDHALLDNIGSNSHEAIDTHIADSTLHFTEASIDHTAIANVGTNTHAELDTHVADDSIHFTAAELVHANISGLNADDHLQYVLMDGSRPATYLAVVSEYNRVITSLQDTRGQGFDFETWGAGRQQINFLGNGISSLNATGDLYINVDTNNNNNTNKLRIGRDNRDAASTLMAEFSEDGLVVNGTISADIFELTGDLSFVDNAKLLLGGSGDLEIYHSGLNSYISDVGTGDLYIQANGLVIDGQLADAYTTISSGATATDVQLKFADDADRWLLGMDSASTDFILESTNVPGTPSISVDWTTGDVSLSALTIADSLSIDGTATATLILNSDSDATVQDASWLELHDAGVLRWRLGKSTINEFDLERYNSSGVYQDTPFNIDVTGQMTLTSTGTLNLSSTATSTQNYNFATTAINGVGLDIQADTVTTGTVLNIDNADALTAGRVFYIKSNSASSTGILSEFRQDHASSTAYPFIIRNDGNRPCLYVESNTTNGPALDLIQNTNARAINIDSAATTAGLVLLECEFVTTADIIDVSAADGLTTGSIMNLKSNSANTGTRSLVKIHNDNALATNATALEIVQDSTGNALDVTGDAFVSGLLSINNAGLGGQSLNVFDSGGSGALAKFQHNNAAEGVSIVGITLGNTVAGNVDALKIAGSTSAGNLACVVQNNDNGNAVSLHRVLGTGDAYSNYQINGGQAWSVGLDNSDSDSFKISGSSVLGTSDYLTIDTSGNAGIGTTTPNANLHVLSSGNGEVEVERTGGALINLQAQATRGVIGTDSNHELQLKTNSGSRMTIDTSGNVGIGDSTPTAKLHVSDATAPTIKQTRTDTGQTWTQGIDSSGRFFMQEAASEGGTAFTRFVIDDTGEVGIGISAPTSLLHVNGTAEIADKITLSQGTTVELDMTSNGVPIYLTGRSSGGATRSVFYADPDDSFYLYYAGDQTFRTTSSGARITGRTGGANPILELANTSGSRIGYINVNDTTGDLTLENEKHGGKIKIVGEDAGGTAQTMIEIDPDTGVGFNGASNIAPPTYTVTNDATDRTYNANSTTLAELADVVGTIIADLQANGLFQ